MKAGQRVRYKRFFLGVRIGSAEPKFVSYMSERWVLVKVYTRNGDLITEEVYALPDFRHVFEEDE